MLEERESRDLSAFALVRRRHRRFGEIETGNGSDVVVDGGGHNIVKTGNGGDQISTGAGDDEIDGGNGFDTCSPGGGSNRVKDCEGLPSPLP